LSVGAVAGLGGLVGTPVAGAGATFETEGTTSVLASPPRPEGAVAKSGVLSCFIAGGTGVNGGNGAGRWPRSPAMTLPSTVDSLASRPVGPPTGAGRTCMSAPMMGPSATVNSDGAEKGGGIGEIKA